MGPTSQFLVGRKTGNLAHWIIQTGSKDKFKTSSWHIRMERRICHQRCVSETSFGQSDHCDWRKVAMRRMGKQSSCDSNSTGWSQLTHSCRWWAIQYYTTTKRTAEQDSSFYAACEFTRFEYQWFGALSGFAIGISTFQPIYTWGHHQVCQESPQWVSKRENQQDMVDADDMHEQGDRTRWWQRLQDSAHWKRTIGAREQSSRKYTGHEERIGILRACLVDHLEFLFYVPLYVTNV